MRIKKISIENFKGIASFEMDFGASVNLFIGANGSGKSTIIEAINLLLSWVEARVRNEKGLGTHIEFRQIRKDAQYARLGITVELEGKSYSWSLYKKAKVVREKLDNDSSFLSESRDCANHIIRIINQGKIPPPIITSFGVNRAVEEIPKGLSGKKHKLAPIDIYEKESQIGFRSLFEWMLERRNIENEEYRVRTEAGEAFQKDFQLVKVEEAITGIFKGKYSDLMVRSNPRRITIKKREGDDKKEYNLEQLSDGEKCYLAIVASIARLLAMATPRNTPRNKDPFKKNPGIVLIDEVDLHLHPEWQLSIIPLLTEIFPSCQFVLTSHSAHVVSSIATSEDCKLLRVESGDVKEIDSNWYGMESDHILLNIFRLPHVRNNKINDLLKKAWEELNKNDTRSKTYKEVKKQIESLLDPNDKAFFELELQEALIAKHEKNK